MILLGALPVILYIVVDRLIDTRPAIGLCVVCTVGVFWYQKRTLSRTSVVFLLGALGSVLMIATGILGMVQDSAKTFWTFDPIEDFLVGGLFLLSALIRRPIVGPVLRELFPDMRRTLPSEHRIWLTITSVWAIKNLAMGAFRVWLLDSLGAGMDMWILGVWDIDDYVWLRIVVGWPINIVLFGWVFYVVRRTVRQELAVQPAPATKNSGSDS